MNLFLSLRAEVLCSAAVPFLLFWSFADAVRWMVFNLAVIRVSNVNQVF